MNISLKKALYNVGNLYNKPEMYQFFSLIVLFPLITMSILGFSIYSAVTSIAERNVSPVTLILSFLGIYIVVLIISLLYGFFVNGIYIKAMHNAISGENRIFPSLTKDFLPILKTGAIYMVCVILTSIVCSIINQIISGIISPLNSLALNGENQGAVILMTVVTVFLFGIYLLQLVFIWVMMISFSRKMKFSQYFDLKWCVKFLKKKVKELTMIGVYNILLSAPVIAAIIALVIYAYPFAKNITPESFVTPMIVMFSAVFIIVVYYYYVQVVNIDLIAQTIRDKSREQI